jgi:hypothetical protein
MDPMTDPAYGLAWSRDGKHIGLASDGGLWVLDPSGQSTKQLSDHKGFVSVAFADDGSAIAAAERNGTITVLGAKKTTTIHDRSASIWSLDFLPRAKQPVLLVPAGDLRLIRVADQAAVAYRAFEVDGKLVGLAMDDNRATGDAAALTKLRVRASADVRSALSPFPSSAKTEGIGPALGN